MYQLWIINQKGGCGKTTTAVNLASLLVELGKKILVIDLDPQAHATISLSIDPEEIDFSTYDFLKYAGEDDFDISQVIVRVEDNFHIIPSHLVLSVFEQAYSGVDGHEYRLRDALVSLENIYDYVIFDCPPSLGLLTFNALMAAHEIIVPVEPSKFSLQGIGRLKDTIKLIEEKTTHSLRTKALITIYDKRTKFAAYMAHVIQDTFKRNVFETIIRQTVRLKEAAFHGKGINKYDKRSAGYEDYKELAKEVIATCEKLTPIRLQSAVHELATRFNNEDSVDLVNVPVVYNGVGAREIRIAGDFNDWTADDEHIMVKDEDGNWKTTLQLSPGRYQYKLLIDGKWSEDDCNPLRIESPFGGYNSLLEVSLNEN